MVLRKKEGDYFIADWIWWEIPPVGEIYSDPFEDKLLMGLEPQTSF